MSGSNSRNGSTIGAGMRVEGDIAFSGVLRIHGDVLGNVVCRGDAVDTVVVEATGSVTGALSAPRIVVRGRVCGPLHCAQSVVIQRGASVAGDVFYREIVIQQGALVEGALMPALPAEAARRIPSGPASAAGGPFPSSAGAMPDDGRESLIGRFGGWGALGGALMLAIVAAVGVWMSRPPATPTAAVAAREGIAPPPASSAAGLESAATNDVRAPAQPATPAPPAVETVIAVQGVNPAKPAGVFLLVGREPAVLYRKKRGEEGEGTRFAVQKGRTASIAIGRNELFRVAEGRDLEIFYQGRKVAPKSLESGAWLSFVPAPSRAD